MLHSLSCHTLADGEIGHGLRKHQRQHLLEAEEGAFLLQDQLWMEVMWLAWSSKSSVWACGTCAILSSPCNACAIPVSYAGYGSCSTHVQPAVHPRLGHRSTLACVSLKFEVNKHSWMACGSTVHLFRRHLDVAGANWSAWAVSHGYSICVREISSIVAVKRLRKAGNCTCSHGKHLYG